MFARIKRNALLAAALLCLGVGAAHAQQPIKLHGASHFGESHVFNKTMA